MYFLTLCALLVAVAQVHAIQSRECPDGYNFSKGNCYKVGTDTKNYNAAQAYCEVMYYSSLYRG